MATMQLNPENIEFLEHFGVRGMRWGVRKKGKAGPKKRLTPKEAEARAKKYAKIGVGLWAGYKIGKALQLPLIAKAASVDVSRSVMKSNLARRDAKRKAEASIKITAKATALTTEAIQYIDATFKN